MRFIITHLLHVYISQYKVSEGELSSRTVWLSVWDWDRFGRNHFLGELKLPLTSLDLRNETGMWYMLLDKVGYISNLLCIFQ